jgi:hypothetical protein
VPILNIDNLDSFNYHSNDNDTNNIDNEMINLFKKLEEKENIISILSFKIEKFEKYLKEFSIEQIKSIISKNNLDEESLEENNEINDGEYIPLEKYNNLLEKLNQTEKRFLQLQKENTELRQYKKLSSNEKIILNKNNNKESINSDDDNNNKINTQNSMKLKENTNKFKINNNNFNNDYNCSNISEEDYYKKKYNQLEMKLKVLRDACKNILIRLNIPKKDREEIKQILKIFEFTEEETLIILGEKKK